MVVCPGYPLLHGHTVQESGAEADAVGNEDALAAVVQRAADEYSGLANE